MKYKWQANIYYERRQFMEFHMQLRAKILFSNRFMYVRKAPAPHSPCFYFLSWNFTRGEQMLCVRCARALKHLELIFCQWHLTSRPHANVGISVKQRMLLNSPIGVHMFWLIEECTTIICIFALHCTLQHLKLYLRHQRWSSFRFFYAIINLFRITISAPKTQFQEISIRVFPYECMSCQYV